jgi:hypothetical protein
METFLSGLKSILKFLFGLTVFLIALLVFAVYFGSSETKFRCEGNISSSPTSTTRVVFLKLQMYKPWIFWANSAGQAWTEVPNKESEYYSDVDENGDYIHFTSSYSKKWGSFSTLSNSILVVLDDGSFEGECKQVEPNT